MRRIYKIQSRENVNGKLGYEENGSEKMQFIGHRSETLPHKLQQKAVVGGEQHRRVKHFRSAGDFPAA